MASLHVQEHSDDLKSVGGKGVASKLDIGDAGLKEMFTGGTTPVISIQEHEARDFCKHGDRNVAMEHWGDCFGCQRCRSARGRWREAFNKCLKRSRDSVHSLMQSGKFCGVVSEGVLGGLHLGF